MAQASNLLASSNVTWLCYTKRWNAKKSSSRYSLSPSNAGTETPASSAASNRDAQSSAECPLLERNAGDARLAQGCVRISPVFDLTGGREIEVFVERKLA